MAVDRSLPAMQQPSACFSCHVLGISSASALGAYMFYQAKRLLDTAEQISCKCEQCLTEYSIFDIIIKLYKKSTGENLICAKYDGIVNETSQTENIKSRDKSIAVMRLFNGEMETLFRILKEIDKIKIHQLSMKINRDIQVIIEKDDIDINFNSSRSRYTQNLRNEIVTYELKSLPAWFARSTVFVERDDEFD
ncbi:unnamed protein product [Rotaria magnacalcarata]|uniref:Uncharacterized protein n=1 Tax=Rotaria magnacalcarata TaxID=392030 RepID=A0A8S2L7G9_9BILA|nr:unnamed protein product [Rotaria magnacalcarata]CAF3897965.1 unnamed protein product [Rotaria magnacalcarata]CAF3918775.1 unnamed protein product [Rotaria magnacalcarata]